MTLDDGRCKCKPGQFSICYYHGLMRYIGKHEGPYLYSDDIMYREHPRYYIPKHRDETKLSQTK